MADIYVKSGGGTIGSGSYRGLWSNSQTWAVGDRVAPSLAYGTAAARGYIYECTTGGAGGSSEPTWVYTTPGTSTTTSGSAVFTCRAPSSWTNALIDVVGAAANDAAGDTIFLSSTLTDSTAGNLTISLAGTTANQTRIISVDDAADPPTTEEAGAEIATTGNGNINLTATPVFVSGVTFKSGTSTGVSDINLQTGTNPPSLNVFKDCFFWINGTVTANRIYASVSNCSTRYINCTFRFSATGSHFDLRDAQKYWYEGGGIHASSSALSTFIRSATIYPSFAEFSGFDLSTISSSAALVNQISTAPYLVKLRNCKFPADWTGSPRTGTSVLGSRVEIYNCDSSGTNYRLWIDDHAGSVRDDSGIYLTGHRDADTPISHKFVSSSSCNFEVGRLYGPEMGAVITSAMVGVSTTATVEAILDSATAINDDEIWLEVMYPGSSTSPLGTWASDAKSNILASGTAQTSSSAAWTGTGGFANAQKRKLTVTFTPQMEGMLVARVVMGKASTTVYVDPDVTLA